MLRSLPRERRGIVHNGRHNIESVFSASVATPFACAVYGLYPADLPLPVTSLLFHGRFVATKPESSDHRAVRCNRTLARVWQPVAAEARACLERTYELALATRPKGAGPDTPGQQSRALAFASGACAGRGGSGESVSTRDQSGSLWSLCDGPFGPACACAVYPGVRARWPAIRVRRWRRCTATTSHGGTLSVASPDAIPPLWIARRAKTDCRDRKWLR